MAQKIFNMYGKYARSFHSLQLNKWQWNFLHKRLRVNKDEVAKSLIGNSKSVYTVGQTCFSPKVNEFKFYKLFHTTSPRNLNPIVALVLRPLAKVAAVLVGRGFRKWWKSLPKDKRKLFYHHILMHKWKYLASFILVGGASITLYQRHIYVTPYTGRKRFMIFDSSQISRISEFSFQMDSEELKPHFLPSADPEVVRTQKICAKLLQGNRDVPEIYTKFWTLFVVNTQEENCKVYPTGQIVMYKGMLDLTDNDDQVAMILAHELSHVILEHSAEIFNYATLLDLLIFIPLALIWAILPNDGLAIIADWFFKRVVDTLLHLPYSRKLEKEADAAGIFLAASACFDVREASAFWGRLDLIEKYRRLRDPEKEIAFLSTHPSNLERQSYLDQLMAGALKTRDTKKCPRLQKPDPREPVWAVQQSHNATPDERKLALANKSLQTAQIVPTGKKS